MKQLIIYAHPNPESINSQFKQSLSAHLLEKGHELKIRDLYEIDFDPILSLEDMQGQRKGHVLHDVAIEQEWITWADCITFIYPIWWTGLPAILKGYIDRVFSYGFAYRYDQGIQKGLLTGKQTVIINTHGKSHAEYSSIGMDQALLLTSDKGIYSYCGLTVNDHFFFEKADKATSEIIDQWIAQIKEIF